LSQSVPTLIFISLFTYWRDNSWSGG